jgi:aspartyl/asparaginyl-tRNA synthetase
MVTPFTSIEDILEGHSVGETVSIRGWIYRKRESKNTIFIVVLCYIKWNRKER